MGRTWYGSFNNRVEENRQFVDTIKVGTGVTEYHYSDRDAYEVVEVKDQKHITIRAYDHKLKGEAFSNDWELISNENNPTYNLTKRGKYWYYTVEITSDILDELKAAEERDDKEQILRLQLYLIHNDVDVDKLRAKGKVTRYRRGNFSIGVANYHYDYSF